MSVVGRTYMEKGEPVEVLVQWRGNFEDLVQPPVASMFGNVSFPIEGFRRRGGPRNVLIRRADGELVVRPFRGLRRPADADERGQS